MPNSQSGCYVIDRHVNPHPHIGGLNMRSRPPLMLASIVLNSVVSGGAYADTPADWANRGPRLFFTADMTQVSRRLFISVPRERFSVAITV